MRRKVELKNRLIADKNDLYHCRFVLQVKTGLHSPLPVWRRLYDRMLDSSYQTTYRSQISVFKSLSDNRQLTPMPGGAQRIMKSPRGPPLAKGGWGDFHINLQMIHKLIWDDHFLQYQCRVFRYPDGASLSPECFTDRTCSKGWAEGV